MSASWWSCISLDIEQHFLKSPEHFPNIFVSTQLPKLYIVHRERDILCLDKPWSVRIVSIACHPSIHLSILETLYTTCPFQELILSSVYLPTTLSPLLRCDETAECAECLQYPARRGTQLANSGVFSGLQLHHSSIPLPPRHPTFVVSGIKAGRIKTEKSSAA